MPLTRKLRTSYLIAYQMLSVIRSKVMNRFPFLWPFWRLLNLAGSNRVLSQFREEIKDTNKNLILVYDFKTVPPTIGDFSYIIVLLRYLIYRNRKVTLVVINSEYREDWDAMDCMAVDGFLNEITKISLALLEKRSFQFRIESWSSKLISELKLETVSVLFSSDVFLRSNFYNLIPNLLNDLLNRADPRLLEKVLFSKLDFPVIEKSLPSEYVTLIVRFSGKWGEERNTKLEDFARTIKLINQKMPGIEIVIVSDQLTCSYFRKEIQRLGLQCSVSKDYSSSFLGDVSVIFGGSHCFQLNAGGICVYPIFSYVPYLFVMEPGNYVPWTARALTSFARSDQQFSGTMRREVFFKKIPRMLL